MRREIFIVHPSEIVRNGLQVILRKFFNPGITLLSHCNELSAFGKTKETHIILIVAPADKRELDMIYRYASANKVDVVQYVDSLPAPVKIEGAAGTLSVHSTSHDIYDLVAGLQNSATAEPSGFTEGSDLTSRELDVLQQVALGLSNKEIAEKLFISIHTVITHRKNITEKLGIKSISGLTVYAILNKIIDTDQINPEDLI